jgi:hypothetical protein
LLLSDNQKAATTKSLRSAIIHTIISSLPAAASHSDCRYRSHPDCRATSNFFRAVGFAQSFTKRGNSHPFDAIGIVACIVVFAGAAVWQGISYLAF